jgi:hypothetical protein
MRWFGKSWDAPICEDLEHAPTPLGEPCGWCREPIEEADNGLLIPHVERNYTMERPHHIECFIRETAGSVAHQLRRCKCFGGGDRGEMEEGMTKREAARQAARLAMA